jgi:acyl-CoA oxidase
LKLNFFRQSRDSLLSRYITLSPNGAVSKDPNAIKMTYGGMLKLRVHIHYLVHCAIAKMSTIAARYSFIRRQFDSKEGKDQPETLVINYQMQQVKIVPAVSATWAHLVTNLALQDIYETFKVELA